MCLYCVSWWCCFGTGHLFGSWSLTVQGYMLDWLGDMTSTVRSCQLSWGVFYPMIHRHIYMLPMGLYQLCEVCNCCIILLLNDILFILNFSSFHVFPPLWQARFLWHCACLDLSLMICTLRSLCVVILNTGLHLV